MELRFLLESGEVITRPKTVPANQRLTINPAGEGDPRLENGSMSTVVTSDVPIVSERSMYWPGDASPFGEGHNSAGIVSTALRWGLAEGRIGGPLAYDTYILLTNATAGPADVRVTFLREAGAAPVVKTYTVPATSRFNIDVRSMVPEMAERILRRADRIDEQREHRGRTIALLDRQRHLLGRRHQRARHAAAVVCPDIRHEFLEIPEHFVVIWTNVMHNFLNGRTT